MDDFFAALGALEFHAYGPLGLEFRHPVDTAKHAAGALVHH
jgi:hypothetical protein